MVVGGRRAAGEERDAQQAKKETRSVRGHKLLRGAKNSGVAKLVTAAKKNSLRCAPLRQLFCGRLHFAKQRLYSSLIAPELMPSPAALLGWEDRVALLVGLRNVAKRMRIYCCD